MKCHGSPAVATAWIAPKVWQGQPPTMFPECSRFNPNRFAFGVVIAELVNTAKTRRKVNPIFGWSIASSQIIIVIGKVVACAFLLYGYTNAVIFSSQLLSVGIHIVCRISWMAKLVILKGCLPNTRTWTRKLARKSVKPIRPDLFEHLVPWRQRDLAVARIWANTGGDVIGDVLLTIEIRSVPWCSEAYGSTSPRYSPRVDGLTVHAVTFE